MHPDVKDAFCARTELLLANAGRYQDRRKPSVSVVTCMDGLFNVHALLGLNESDAHILRNAGGVVTDDVIRSLAIGHRLLENTDVMLIAHAACRVCDAGRDVAAEVRRGVARLRSDPTLRRTNGIRGFFFNETTGELREIS